MLKYISSSLLWCFFEDNDVDEDMTQYFEVSEDVIIHIISIR